MQNLADLVVEAAEHPMGKGPFLGLGQQREDSRGFSGLATGERLRAFPGKGRQREPIQEDGSAGSRGARRG